MKNLWYLFAAYMIIWILISGYFFKISSKIRKLEEKLESVKSELKG